MIHVREKILLYGGSNSGKTHAALLFVQSVIASGKRGFVIDADDGASKLIAEMDEFELLRDAYDTPRLSIVSAYDYTTALTAITQFTHKFKPTPGDVVVLEMIGNHWEWAQAEFSSHVKHESMAQVQLDKAEDGRLQFGGLDGKTEWPVVKKLYFDITTPTLQSPAHCLWTTGAKDLVDALESIDIMDMFGGVRQKPEGNKGLHWKPDTVIHMSTAPVMVDGKKVKQRVWSTPKDRGKRERLTRIPYTTLFDEYYSLHSVTPPWGNQ